MSVAGWYPDPGGQPGMFRYWTGAEWTPVVTADPAGTPAPAASAPPQSAAAYDPNKHGSIYTDTTAKKGSRRGAVVAGVAGVVVIALIVGGFFLFRGNGPIVFPGGDPSPTITVEGICPRAPQEKTKQDEYERNGRVYGGAMSYEKLGDPWSGVQIDDRVPYADVAPEQIVVDQENYNGTGAIWVSSVLISDLYVGDGFGSAQNGAEIILKCVLGTFYADNEVKNEIVSAGKHDVDGHSGWLIETKLSFNIPNLNATSEQVLLLVVSTGQEKYSLFYASVPNTAENLMPDARRALDSLKIDG